MVTVDTYYRVISGLNLSVIRHRSGLTAVMDRRTGEYVHGVRPVYDGWIATLAWMDDDDTTADDTGSSWPPLIS